LLAGSVFAAPFTSEKGGFSIELPNGWEPLSKKELDPMSSSGVYLVAIDRAAVKTGATLMLTVNINPVPASMTTKMLASAPLSAQMAAGAKDIKKEVKTLGGAEWVVNSYTKEVSGASQATVFYASIQGEKLVNLNFTLDKLEGSESLVENTVNSYKAK
jgi:hypothetical protein